MESSFSLDWGFAIGSLPILLEGVKFTIIIALVGILLGFIIGLIMSLARLSKNKIVYGISTVYVEVIRGTPLMVQALYIYFAIPLMLGVNVDPLLAGIAAIAINAGAYISEIIRGAIQSIEKGQTEAGRSLGLNKIQTFIHVVWPQAFKGSLPSLGNQFIISLKDTSLLTMIGVAELTRQGTMIVSSSFRAVEIYTMVGLTYLVLTLSISFVLRSVERRMTVE